MVGHGVGLKMENALDLNMSIRLWSMVVGWWWFGDAQRLLGRENGTKLKVGCMDRHFYNFILEISCGPLYRYTTWIQVSFNKITIPSTQARLCKNGWHHERFNFFRDMHMLRNWIPLLGTSQMTLEHIYDTSKGIQELWEHVCLMYPKLMNILHVILWEHATKNRRCVEE